MALKFHERERLLPPESMINYDDDVVLSENRRIARNGSGTESIWNGFGSSSSGLSSPFGSDIGSTETESSEEDDNGEFIAELTRQMADYMLEEDDENASKYSFSGSGGKLGSTRDRHSQKLQSTLYGPTSIPAHAYQSFSKDQSRDVHFYKLENQPPVKTQGPASWGRRVKGTELTQQQNQDKKLNQVENRATRAAAVGGGGGFSGIPATAWPPLQRGPQPKQQVGSGSGSGMRAVFLGGPGSRSGSCGTGVFLPRGISNPTEVRKKSECSTVLIPARVIQALQLHFRDMNTRSSQSKGSVAFTSHPSQHDVGLPQSTRPDANHHEMDLPQEWTY